MNKWILKILSGSHQGAEVPLKIGQYKIGKADTDDLIISDAALLEGHFILDLTETSAHIRLPKDREPIWIDNEPVHIDSNDEEESSTHEVVFPHVISIGTLKMVVGLATENWQKVRLPEKADIPETSIQLIAERDIPQKKVTKKSRTIYKLCTYTGVFVALFFVGIALYDVDHPEENIENIYISQSEKWENLKGKLNTKTIVFSEDKKGAKINGRLKTESELNQLVTVLDLANINVKMDIIVDEILKNELMKELSTLQESTLKVKLSEQLGEFIVTGEINSKEELDNALKKIKEDSPEYLKIANETTTKNQVDLPKSIRMGLNVRSVNIGRTPYFITDTGQKFVNGSVLQSGLIIKEINANHIQLKKGEEVFLHLLGAN